MDEVKALELVNKYYTLLNPNFPNINVLFEDCKKCALITAEEMINEFEFEEDILIFWQMVKQKINRL
jgi:hypothetical protein